MVMTPAEMRAEAARLNTEADRLSRESFIAATPSIVLKAIRLVCCAFFVGVYSYMAYIMAYLAYNTHQDHPRIALAACMIFCMIVGGAVYTIKMTRKNKSFPF